MKKSYNEKKASLIRLQREYVERSIGVLNSMIPMIEGLTLTDDPDTIREYIQQLDEMEQLVNDNCVIANKIQESYEHLRSGQRPPSSRP